MDLNPKLNNILSSKYNSVKIPSSTETSVIQLLLEKAKQHDQDGTGKNWMTNAISSHTITYADIEPSTRKIASGLTKCGFKAGDVVIYFTTDVTTIYQLILGVWRCGGCCHASYVEDKADTIARRIKQTKARWIFCDIDYLPAAEAAIKSEGIDWGVEILVFGGGGDDAPSSTLKYANVLCLLEDDGEDCPDKVEVGPDNPLIIFCTSGTTGHSKGALHTNSTILAEFHLELLGSIRNPSPALYISKCTHIIGCLHAFRNILIGNWTVMMSSLTLTNICNAIQDYKPYLIFSYPTYLMALVMNPEAKSYDLSSVQAVATGGVVVTQSMRDTIWKLPNLQVLNVGCSLNECPAMISTYDGRKTNQISTWPNLPANSVGQLYTNVELRILDLDSGASLGPNAHGEIAIKSPGVCAKYYTYDPLKGENVEISPLDGDGWFHTGDLGYHDENGFIFVLGRLKETFKYGNNHVNPTELEEILLQHPAVAEAAVLGILDPISLNHIPAGFVVLKPNADAKKAVDLNEIKEFVNGKVASYKQFPNGGIHILESLPRGKTGKIDKNAIEAAKFC